MPRQPKGHSIKSKSKMAASADSSTTASAADPLTVSSSQSERPADLFSMQKQPVFFWKPDEPNGFLGQWYRSPFVAADDQVFCSCEQYMMWRKAQTFGDAAAMAAILAETSPRKLKALGQKVKGFDSSEWDAIKLEVVTQGNLYKFRQCDALDYDRFVYGPEGFVEEGEETASTKKSLRELLLATGDAELAEASTFDRIWGIGYSAANAEQAGRKQWGQNLLGKALMEVRRVLREEDEKRE